jgi:hypothetical protein
MSLNLGAAAFDAVQNLKNGRDWQIFKSALHEQMNRSMHAALEANADRDMVVGYARAIRDVVAQIETFEQGTQKNGRMQRPIFNSGAENVG